MGVCVSDIGGGGEVTCERQTAVRMVMLCVLRINVIAMFLKTYLSSPVSYSQGAGLKESPGKQQLLL